MSRIIQQKNRITVAISLAVAIAIPAEGIRRMAYFDPVSIMTVCYGHTGPDVQKGREYSLKDCEAFLTIDMMIAINQVESCHPGLPTPVLAAFSDAVFNMGPTIACDTRNSTAARLLKLKDYDGACRQLTKWDKARVSGILVALPGLTKRRASERDLCLTWKQA